MNHHNTAQASQEKCTLALDRDAFRELNIRLSDYRSSGAKPPLPLVKQHRELLDYFAAVSQGR